MSQCWLVSLDKGNLPTNGSGCSFQQTFVGKETRDEPLRTSAWEATPYYTVDKTKHLFQQAV